MDLDLCIYNLHLKDLLHLDTALRQEKHMVGRALGTRETGSPCAWSPGDPWETGVGDSGAATRGRQSRVRRPTTKWKSNSCLQTGSRIYFTQCHWG